MHQIMIGVHVNSLRNDAEALMKYLVGRGYTVFLSTEMDGGSNKAIIYETAAKCEVYIPLMNREWCTSAECQFEFNVALSESLRSPSRTPYIVPVLLEDLSFYDNFLTLKSFLINTTAITAKKRDLEGGLTWTKVFKSIQNRNISPVNPKPVSRLGLSMSFESPFTSPVSSPTYQTVPSAPFSPTIIRRISPTPPSTKGETKRISPRPRTSLESPTDLSVLVHTCDQLTSEICKIKVYGINQFHKFLEQEALKLKGMTIGAESESALRALVDYLSKTTELLPAWKSDQTRCPITHFIQEDIAKLMNVIKLPYDPIYYAGEFIKNFETRLLWDTHFGKNKFAVQWQQFVDALKKDTTYKTFAAAAEATGTLNDLRTMLDHYNTGYVVCHRLSDFAKNQPLLFALQKFHDHKFIEEYSQATLRFPLLLWIDENTQNNSSLIGHARNYGITLVLFNTTLEAKQWIDSNPYVLKSKSFRIITGNKRIGAGTILDLNSGEDITRFVRGRRSNVPILVYCGDLVYAQYVAKYEHCQATTAALQCQSFIEQMFSFK